MHGRAQIVSSLPAFNKKLTRQRKLQRKRQRSPLQGVERRRLGEDGNATAEISTANLEGVVRQVTNILVAVEQDTMVLTLATNSLNPKC